MTTTAPPLPRETENQPAWEIARLFPYQGDWDEWDYLELDTNHLVEFTEGYVEVLEMPTQSHQQIVRFLFLALLSFVEERKLGEVLFAPLRVRLRPRVIREPDVAFMKSEHAHRRGEEYWEGADLVVEVVSSDLKSRERDLKKKRSEYAQAGIPEYWIVDPMTETITVLRLAGSEYQAHGEFKRGEQATSALLPGFSVAVTEALEGGRK